MRFVAGRSAVTEMLLQGAPWHSCYWQGCCSEEPSGRCCWQRRCGGAPSGRRCWPGRCGGSSWQQLLARAAGENSRQQQTGNGHLTEQARNVNLTKQPQDAILAELVRLSFWQTRSLRDCEKIVKRSGRDKGTNKKAASRRVSKLAA